MEEEPPKWSESRTNGRKTMKQRSEKPKSKKSHNVGNDHRYLRPEEHVTCTKNVVRNTKQNVKSITEPEACTTVNIKTISKENTSAPITNKNIIHSAGIIEQPRLNRSVVPYDKTVALLQSESTPVISGAARDKSILIIIKYAKNNGLNKFQRGIAGVTRRGHHLLKTIDKSFNESLNNRLTRKANHIDENMDINLFLELVEITYNTFHHLSDFLTEGMLKAKRHGINQNFVIKVDMRKFVRYLSLQYEHNKKMIKDTSQQPRVKELTISNRDSYSRPKINYLPYKAKSFDVCIQRKCMTYKISISKFNSFSKRILKMLALMYNSGILSFDINESKHALTASRRWWHVTDVTQGFMLTLLLRNSNVVSLNFMRKLYFVIITRVTPNLTLTLNFKLTHGIFVTYATKPFEDYPLNNLQWKIRHNDAGKVARVLSNTICEVGRSISESDDADLQVSTSDTSCDASTSTLKNDSAIESYESEDLENSFLYTDSDYYDMKSNADVGAKGSTLTLTLSIDEILSAYGNNLYDVRKACGDTNLTDIVKDNSDISSSTLEMSKIWLSRVYNESISMRTGVLSKTALDSFMNESIFDKLTLDQYIRSFRHYWVQCNTDVFFKYFFKRLGFTLFHILFSSVIN